MKRKKALSNTEQPAYKNAKKYVYRNIGQPACQDSQWSASSATDETAVVNNRNDLSTVATNYDFTSLDTCAGILYKDGQKVMNDSDSYNV